ncbi:UV-B-induced protein [Senna tora]|uniref:UV-B-induced protein n=1 Tax=Senna tora TaxID=362788 RepID=A0A834T3D5_9FABA|nr:UV-B-induced protein [Senna tora]KAF7813496.1 UV-B-induced protein [Senna tora]
MGGDSKTQFKTRWYLHSTKLSSSHREEPKVKASKANFYVPVLRRISCPSGAISGLPNNAYVRFSMMMTASLDLTITYLSRVSPSKDIT